MAKPKLGSMRNGSRLGERVEGENGGGNSAEACVQSELLFLPRSFMPGALEPWCRFHSPRSGLDGPPVGLREHGLETESSFL